MCFIHPSLRGLVRRQFKPTSKPLDFKVKGTMNALMPSKDLKMDMKLTFTILSMVRKLMWIQPLRVLKLSDGRTILIQRTRIGTLRTT